jgi:hypothetical protein
MPSKKNIKLPVLEKTNIRNKYKNPILQQSFNAEKMNVKNFTNREITKIANSMRKDIRKKLPNHKVKYQVSYKMGSQYYTSKYQPTDFVYFEPEWNDEYTKYKAEEKNSFSNFFLNYTIVRDADSKGGCGYANDCLYDCLKELSVKCFNDVTLKLYLGVERKDQVDVKLMRKLEEHDLMKKYAINVSGDDINTSYISPTQNRKMAINLILKDKHYTVDKAKCPFIAIPDKKKNMKKKYIVVFDNDWNMYDGKTITKSSYKELEKTFNTPLKYSPSSALEEMNVFNLKDFYDYMNEVHRKLTNETFIDIRKTPRIKDICRYIYNQFQKTVTMENIPYHEYQLLNEATIGGLMYSKKSEECTAYKYDFRAHYASVLQNPHLLIPIKKFKGEYISELPKILKTGLYKVKIETDRTDVINFFKQTTYLYYTHTDIKYAISKNFNVKLYDNDGNVNFLYYDTCINSSLIFEKSIKYLYNLKNGKFKNDLWMKTLVSAFWGSFTESKKQTIRVSNDVPQYDPPEGYDIERHYEDGNDKVVTLKNIKSPAVCNEFRMKPFLLSKAREVVLKLFEKAKVNYEDILYIHTDGFILKKPLEEKFIDKQSKIGGLKYEGKCDNFWITNMRKHTCFKEFK